MGYTPYAGTITLKQSPGKRLSHNVLSKRQYQQPIFGIEYEYKDDELVEKPRKLPTSAKATWYEPVATRKDRRVSAMRSNSNLLLLEDYCDSLEKTHEAIYNKLCRKIVPAQDLRKVPCLSAPIFFYFNEATIKENQTGGIDPIHNHFVAFLRDPAVHEKFRKLIGDDTLNGLHRRIQGSQIKTFTFFKNESDWCRNFFYMSYAEAERHPVIGTFRGFFPTYFCDHKAAYLRPLPQVTKHRQAQPLRRAA